MHLVMTKYEQVEQAANQKLRDIEAEMQQLQSAKHRREKLVPQATEQEEKLKEREDEKKRVWNDMYQQMEKLSKEYNELKGRVKDH